jgi:hypothetical protein
VLFHLSPIPSPFCFRYSSDRVLRFCSGQPQTVILLPCLPHSWDYRPVSPCLPPPNLLFYKGFASKIPKTLCEGTYMMWKYKLCWH